MAIDILKPHQGLIQQMLNGRGELDINKLYSFYETIYMRLAFARDKRKNNFEDVIFTEVKDAV
jgi:hypothetical protein